MTAVAVAAVILATLAQAAPSPAPPRAPSAASSERKVRAKAQLLLRQGNRLYEKHDYQGALDKFESAYAAFASPKLLFNIGQAHRELGHPVEALEAFEWFLREGKNTSPARAKEVERSIAELRATLGQVDVDSKPQGAEISLDGKVIGTTPLPRSLWTTPGEHRIAGQKVGFSPASQVTAVTAGTAEKIVFMLRPLVLAPAPDLSARPAPPPPPPSLFARPWFWAAVGGVVLGAATAVVVLR